MIRQSPDQGDRGEGHRGADGRVQRPHGGRARNDGHSKCRPSTCKGVGKVKEEILTISLWVEDTGLSISCLPGEKPGGSEDVQQHGFATKGGRIFDGAPS